MTSVLAVVPVGHPGGAEIALARPVTRPRMAGCPGRARAVLAGTA